MQQDHGFSYSLAQDFSTLALLILQPKQFFFFCYRDSHVHYKMFSSIPGFYPLEASSKPLKLQQSKNISRHCRKSIGQQNLSPFSASLYPPLRTMAVVPSPTAFLGTAHTSGPLVWTLPDLSTLHTLLHLTAIPLTPSPPIHPSHLGFCQLYTELVLSH